MDKGISEAMTIWLVSKEHVPMASMRQLAVPTQIPSIIACIVPLRLLHSGSWKCSADNLKLWQGKCLMFIRFCYDKGRSNFILIAGEGFKILHDPFIMPCLSTETNLVAYHVVTTPLFSPKTPYRVPCVANFPFLSSKAANKLLTGVIYCNSYATSIR